MGQQPALQFKENRGSYRTMPWQELKTLVFEMAYGLAASGLEPGDAVGIFAPTSHLWVAADLATICNGAISVPLYPNSSLNDIQHIMNNSGATVAFVSGESLLKRFLQAKEAIPGLQKIVYIPPLSDGKMPKDLIEQDGRSGL